MDPAKGGVHTDVAGGIVRAATALAEAGYAIEDVEPPGVLAAAELWGALVTTDVRMDLPAWKNLISRDALYYIEAVLAVNRELDREGYARALAERLRIAREWAIFFETYSIVLGPIFTQPPFLVGDDLQGPERAAELQHAARLVIAVNLLGLPAVAVPAGLANGLPQAVQLIAGLYREDLCLEAAQVIEDRLGVLTPLDASNAGRRPSAGK
jgi:amidase